MLGEQQAEIVRRQRPSSGVRGVDRPLISGARARKVALRPEQVAQVDGRPGRLADVLGLDHPLIGDTRARKVALLAQQTPELERRSGLVVGLLGAHRLIGALRACVTLLGQ